MNKPTKLNFSAVRAAKMAQRARMSFDPDWAFECFPTSRVHSRTCSPLKIKVVEDEIHTGCVHSSSVTNGNMGRMYVNLCYVTIGMLRVSDCLGKVYYQSETNSDVCFRIFPSSPLSPPFWGVSMFRQVEHVKAPLFGPFLSCSAELGSVQFKWFYLLFLTLYHPGTHLCQFHNDFSS